MAEATIKPLDGVIVRNSELQAAFDHPCLACVPVGVDTKLFPARPKHYTPGERPLRVGWCAQTGGITSFKGHDEILVPLRQSLSDCNIDWSVNTNDYTTRLSIEEMRDWYHSLDVFVSTSSAEGTPNPPFEAMACGTPIIATRVGCLADIKEEAVQPFLVPTYKNPSTAAATIEAIRKHIIRFAEGDDSPYAVGSQMSMLVGLQFSYLRVAPRILRFVCEGTV